MKPLICIPAFSRAYTLERLLKSLKYSYYPEITPLIISIEYDANPSVIEIAEKFNCEYLDKKIIYRKSKLGLRNHIIECCKLVNQYESIIILEDDLLVDRYFYHYASESLDFYKDVKNISGISLYSYQLNEINCLPFIPLRNGYSNYLMQFASSWGQCWTKQQFNEFYSWYKTKNERDLLKIKNLPKEISRWRNSWKKYFCGYLVENNKFFVYPYESYSTNCSDDIGTNNTVATNLYQVPLGIDNRPKPSFNFCPYENQEVLYDVYFEQCGNYLLDKLGVSREDINIDIYGNKPLELIKSRKYTISSKPTKNSLKKYPIKFKPIEDNIQKEEPEKLSKNSLMVNLSFSENIEKEIPITTSTQLLNELTTARLLLPKRILGLIFLFLNKYLDKLYMIRWKNKNKQ